MATWIVAMETAAKGIDRCCKRRYGGDGALLLGLPRRGLPAATERK